MPDDTFIALLPTTLRESPRSDLRLRALPGVYGPGEDSHLLAAALGAEPLDGARVLDLCTGTGFLAVTAARAGAAEIVAIDVSRRAVLNARLNLWRRGRRGAVRRGDLLRAAPSGPYDVIVSNPPYVPAPDDRLPTHGPARSWDGGRDGRAIIDRICADAPARLRPGGRLLMVHSGVADAERTVDLLRAAGLDAEVAVRREIPFGPVMRRRASLLREAELIDEGQRTEELLVIRAQAPAARAGTGAAA